MYEAYQDVRDDNSPTAWAVFKYDGKVIKLAAKGESYDEFISHFAGMCMLDINAMSVFICILADLRLALRLPPPLCQTMSACMVLYGWRLATS